MHELVRLAVAGKRRATLRRALRDLVEGLESGRQDPSEVNAVIGALGETDAKAVSDALEFAKRALGAKRHAVRFSSALLSAAKDAREVKLLTGLLPAFEPTPGTAKSTLWITAGDIDIENIRHDDVNQGALSNCWLISAIAAQAVADPAVLRDHIRLNPNGTYTVTLFKNGIATPVTITADLPGNGHGVTFAGGGSSGREPNWASLFEKAAAQAIGGGRYMKIALGIGSTGISVVAGPAASTYGPRVFPWQLYLSFDDIKEMVENRRPIVPMTGLAWNDKTITGRHAYYVVAVTSDRRIIVRNPWGIRGPGSVPTVLQLKEEHFNKKFITAGAGDQAPLNGEDPSSFSHILNGKVPHG